MYVILLFVLFSFVRSSSCLQIKRENKSWQGEYQTLDHKVALLVKKGGEIAAIASSDRVDDES